uniref:SHSP domain-containing protein n=1 Tax=Melanopsichium pennsylvanicum 4 TaxID=1398559 RepID=A0A077QRZ5_9BASI|nr:putative protein [Melanopsichium pennsylvanicum 4]
MRFIAGSQVSCTPSPDSLASLSDHHTPRSSTFTHTSPSALSSYWADSTQTHLPTLDLHNDSNHTSVYGAHTHPASSSTGFQPSSTIKASSHTSGLSSDSERATPLLDAMVVEPSIVDPTSAPTTSPPVLHSLVFPSSSTKCAAGKTHTPSNNKSNDPYLALDEAAPRLSMSSTGSGSTTELATPENLHQSWSYNDADRGSALAAFQRASASTSSSPSSLTQALKEQKNLPSTPEVDLRPPSRKLDVNTVQLDRLAIQRPAKLERLSSGATNATAKGSTRSDESPQTATQSPSSFQPSDLSSLRISSRTDAPASTSSSQLSKSPSLENHIPSRATMTSPDSWRSLLPEHDPYFASERQLRALSHHRSASPQSLHSSYNAFDIEAYAAAKSSPRPPINDRMSESSSDTARTSFSSAISGYSTMFMAANPKGKPSMQSQSYDPARRDSWRSLLPDDDRYHASRAACTSGRGLEASPCLTSPPLSDHLDSAVPFHGHNHRSAFFALQESRSSNKASSADSESAARRHSSFSSVEPNNSSQYAATRNMLASMRHGARCFGSSASASGKCVYASGSTGGFLSPRGIDSLDAPSMTPALSNSTEDDSSERDSWPTSRGAKYGRGASSPMSSGPMTPKTEHTPHKSSLAAVLSQEAGRVARVDSPAHVSETSDTRSEAGVDHCASFADEGEQGLLQSQPMQNRSSSCSISTPISPPSLPFLERRPAPPETDLVIETERTKYVLVTRLPGFSLDCITLATKQHKHHRTLHIVADKWDTEGGGHFERRITFPDRECDLKNVKAEFDGNTLKVHVPRRNGGGGTRFSSASSATF